jgi:oligopeptide transport system substrate-binding protein
VRTIDPALNTDVASQRPIDDLFEGLTRTDAAGEAAPGVAERWEQSADGLRWTFHLRADARWSNGERVTAQDFVYGWRRVVDPKTASQSAQQLAPVANALEIASGKLPPEELGISAPDERTVEVRLVTPTGYFPYLVTNSYYYPQPAGTIEKHGRGWTRPENIVGNGAFVLESQRINGATVLRRSDTYWDAAAVRLKHVSYFPVSDYGSATARFLAGDLDSTDGFLVDDVDRLRARLGDQVRLAPYLGTVMLGMNVSRPPFDSAKLRRAMTLAIDRDVISSKLMHGLFVAANGMVAPLPDYPGVPPDWQSLSMEQRLQEARSLYAEAGYSKQNPLRVALNYPTNTPDTKRVLEALTAMWRANLGAEVQLANNEWRVFQQNRHERLYDLYWYSWIGDFPDASTFLNMVRIGNGENSPQYADASYEAAMDAAARSVDDAVRLAHYAEAEKILNEAVIVLPIYYYQSRHLVRGYVHGMQDNVVDRHLSRNLYLQNPTQ